MSFSATYTATCTAEGCTTVQVTPREILPGETPPSAVVPPGWYQDRFGQAHCPDHAEAARESDRAAAALLRDPHGT